ncbi:MAG: carboxypeptidase-like regulatory domain-containing protein [Patescibacteria group bacterium]|jgi:hypothetical protein
MFVKKFVAVAVICILAGLMVGCAAKQQAMIGGEGKSPVLQGQGIGKITGVVLDQNNEPLVGVSVALVGTRSGAMTNEEGRYTILNVRTGRYSLQFSLPGYKTLTVDEVEVRADLATYLDQKLY